MSIYNKWGIRYGFPVMAVPDNGRCSPLRCNGRQGGSMLDKQQTVTFESYSNKRHFQSLMAVFR